jgi:hypothetical protein
MARLGGLDPTIPRSGCGLTVFRMLANLLFGFLILGLSDIQFVDKMAAQL